MNKKNKNKNRYPKNDEDIYIKQCKNFNRKNKKSRKQKYSYSNNHIKPPVENRQVTSENIFKNILDKIKCCFFTGCFYIIIIIFFTMTITYIDAFSTFPVKRFNFQIVNYKITDSILSTIDIIGLKDSFAAYVVRNNLLNQYIHMYKTNDKNLYDVIGTFKLLNDDFSRIYTDNNNQRAYLQYKEKYMAEAEKIIAEYSFREVSRGKYFEFNRYSRTKRPAFIMNRITFYPYLAYYYYIFGDLENIEPTQDNLEKLKNILNTADVVMEQEKSKNSEHYKNILRELYDINFKEGKDFKVGKVTFVLGGKHKYFENINNNFNYLYTKKIILTENDLNPDNFCTNKDVFEKYLISSSHLFKKHDEPISQLLSNKCQYNTTE